MLSSPPDSASACELQHLLGISRRTVLRWRQWWTQEFIRTRLWVSLRSHLMAPIAPAQLPRALLDRLRSPVPAKRLAQTLRLLSPLSIPRMIK